jgi:hypothetical protein
MRFRPEIRPRERILVLGVGGVGKSKLTLDIARKCPHDTFYIWDNDFSTERLLSTDYTDIADRPPVDVEDDDLGVAWGNIIVRTGDAEDWQELLDWLDLVKKYNSPDDWVTIDSASPTWPAVQGWFTEQVHGSDVADYFLEVRQAKKNAKEEKKTLGALDGWMDWPVINKQYNKFYRKLLNIGCHWVITAEQDKISDDDDKDVRGLFGAYGVKPKGQKSMGHKPSTVLLLTKSRGGNYAMTTIKDRGRPDREDEEWGDFVADYLVPSGWKMRKVEG